MASRRKTRSHSESSIGRPNIRVTPTRNSLQLTRGVRTPTVTSPLSMKPKEKTGSNQEQEDIGEHKPGEQMDKIGGNPESSSKKETNSTSKPAEKSLKSKCPCNVSSNGKSWLLACNACGQVWHNRCANLKGDKLTQDAVNSILKDWQCPWCYVTPFPCPKSHKAAKTKSSLENVSHANEFLATVVDSLEKMVDTKLTEVLKTNTASVEAIGKQLMELSQEISSFKNSQSPPVNLPPQAPGGHNQTSTQPLPPIEVDDTPLTHNTNYIDDLIEDFLTPEEENDITDLLDNETFVNEGSRGVLQFGEHYKYMGSKTEPKACPEVIKRIMDRLNEEVSTKHQDSRYHYRLNSCLVNKYQGNTSTLPEHSDDEGDICPWSSIFTVSVGGTRTVLFRNTQNDEETPVYCKGRSLYQMTRNSQDFFKHQIKAEPGQEDAPRYSLTFRAIHWANFNSTILVGDSNFGKIQFGTGKGSVGQATPGLRTFAPKVADIDPLACSSYRNVVIMAGTNDLKKNITDPDITDLYKTYKLKISQIRKYNPKCKIFICPVLPTKSSVINQRVFKFNNYICNDLIQSNLKASLVEGFFEFVDKQSYLLRDDYSVNDINDILHINNTKGVRLLVRLIKHAIFRAKISRTVNGRTFANVTRGGPADPI